MNATIYKHKTKQWQIHFEGSNKTHGITPLTAKYIMEIQKENAEYEILQIKVAELEAKMKAQGR